MAELGNMLKRAKLKEVPIDCTFDYDGARFYARDDIDHKVDLPSQHEVCVDTETGEFCIQRK